MIEPPLPKVQRRLDRRKAHRLATRVGGRVRHRSLRAAAEFGEVVPAALPYGAGEDVAERLHAALRRRAVVRQ